MPEANELNIVDVIGPKDFLKQLIWRWSSEVTFKRTIAGWPSEGHLLTLPTPHRWHSTIHVSLSHHCHNNLLLTLTLPFAACNIDTERLVCCRCSVSPLSRYQSWSSGCWSHGSATRSPNTFMCWWSCWGWHYSCTRTARRRRRKGPLVLDMARCSWWVCRCMRHRFMGSFAGINIFTSA